ncbi:MAG: hypothetical protein K6G61_12885 [Solobacterium sp.]|nr:hypothetical protein [Solobacterium sp.]
MGLTDAWKSEEMIRYFLGLSKTKSDTDRRSCAVHAFLAGKSRTYSTDRFLNYWTAMNAYYGFFGDNFSKTYKEKYHKLTRKYNLINKDSKTITVLICSEIKKDLIIMDFKLLKDPKEEEKKDKDSEDKGEKKKETFYTNKLLYECTGEDIDDLYDDALANLDSEVGEGNPYKPLYNATDAIGIPLYVYLLLVYPYMLRCNYFHGNTVQPVIAGYRDPEIFDLNIINRFLERYLTEKIPTMFEDQVIDDESFEYIKRICEYWENNQHNKMNTYLE